MRYLLTVILILIGMHAITAQGGSTTSVPITKASSASTFSILELTKPQLLVDLKLKESTFRLHSLSIYSPSLKHTAFFCKMEDRLGKRSKLPLKMRLGDLDYVNTLEGKNNFSIKKQE